MLTLFFENWHYPLKTREYPLLPMKGNLCRVKEMIFNFCSIAIQRLKSGLGARLENSFQGVCECHKLVS